MTFEHAPQATERQTAAAAVRPAQSVSSGTSFGGGMAPTAIGLRPSGVLALQRAAGNAAVRRALSSPTVQRQPKTAGVGPIAINNQMVTVPISSGASLQASVPSGQTVTWSLVAGTAAIDAGSSISSTGLVTLGGTQAGGRISIRAADAAGSTSTAEVLLIKSAGSIASTSVSGAGASVYGGFFKHTFAPAGGGKASEMEGGRVNEIFTGLKNPIDSPFGSFSLKTNNAEDTAGGWGILTSGEMNDVDRVTISRAMVDIRTLITNTSNPAPTHTLPASFPVTQDLRALEFPAKKFGKPFVTVSHVRGLRLGKAGPEFFVSANAKESVSVYSGPPAVRGIKASTTSVQASPAPPPAVKGKKPAPAPGTPATVQISAESLPGSTAIAFSIRGAALGCKIDAASGLLTVGSTAGTVKVRASVGDGKSFDELDITITPIPAPAPAKPPGGAAAPGGKQSELDLEPEGLDEQAVV